LPRNKHQRHCTSNEFTDPIHFTTSPFTSVEFPMTTSLVSASAASRLAAHLLLRLIILVGIPSG